MLKLEDLKRVSRTTVNLAGPRYTPGIDRDAPSIAIDHLKDVTDALALSAGFREKLRAQAAEISRALERSKYSVGPIFGRRRLTPERLIDQLNELVAADGREDLVRGATGVQRTATAVARHLEESLEPLRDESYSLSGQGDSEKRSSLDMKIRDLESVGREVDDLLEYLVRDPGSAIMRRNCFLLLGAWGTGKTHFLCDVALGQLAEGNPALVVLASTLAPDRDPLDSIAEISGLASNGDELLQALTSLAKQSGSRALLLIDAVNEGDRPTWKRFALRLARRVRRFPDVGLVLSCRRPFEETIFTPGARKLYRGLEHYGFQERELEAQLEFFGYYGIPTPQIPFLNFEFSRPLFLKLMCEALQGLTKRTQKRKLREIASGQKSMTHVLEHFTRRVGKGIEVEFGLPGKSCWWILKGSTSSSTPGVAGSMAARGREWLSVPEAIDAIQESTGFTPARCRLLLKRFVTDGLLMEDVRWDDDHEAVEAVQFSYQRFGDHLIARHLLDEHLIQTTESGIRHAFYSNRPLGKVFSLNQWNSGFRYPGLVAAIMLEFPERMKRLNLPQELVQYLPKRCLQVNVFKEVFLDGLYWRSRESFNDITDRLIAFLLSEVDEYARGETLEVLVALASRSGHPHNARRLDAYLRSFSMAECDLTWSEFVRTRDEHSSLYRLLKWVEANPNLETTEQDASNEICLISLMLTTTDRRLRDRATRALVRLGSVQPRSLFSETLHSLDFPDPYVRERMLAAAYGVSMRRWATPNGQAVRDALPSFARQLVKEMFLPGAKHGSRHVLQRDYALGVIELARKVSPDCIATKYVSHLRGDFSQIPSPFVVVKKISADDVAQVKRALHMDFNNYTLGRLVPDRGNYQEDHAAYQAMRKQILRRMRDLGYTSDRFEREDTMIARMQSYGRSDEPGRVDRYGKKYSWIAFFEMFGVRFDAGLLDERRINERVSDADIDPSFPEPQKTWMPPLPNPFSRAPRLPDRWLKKGPTPDYQHLLAVHQVDANRGPWLLLDGFIRQKGSHNREAFAFLRGLFVSESAKSSLEEHLAATSYPGNHKIPEAASDYYTYAGEIPWSPRFAGYARKANGSALRHVEFAFERYEKGKSSGVPVEVPSHFWAWESYHSSINQVSGVHFPAPALCEFADLVNYEDSFDLRDRDGRLATIYRDFDVGDTYGRSHLLYMRADLVEDYLESTNQMLVWIPWGERGLDWKEYERPLEHEIHEAMREDAHIFSDLVEYV